MTMVVLLWHRRRLDDEGAIHDSKLIGVFRDDDDAQKAREVLSELEGFRDYPDDFSTESLPVDLVLTSREESGLSAIVREYVSWSRESRPSGGNAPPPSDLRVLPLVELGESSFYAVLEELYSQVRDSSQAEELERELVSWWIPANMRLPHREGSHTRSSAAEIARLAWEYRRLRYPMQPDWQDPAHPLWQRMVSAHKQVVLLDGVDDDFVLSILVELTKLVIDDGERDYLRLGLLTTWLTSRERLGPVGAKLAARRSVDPALDALVRGWEERL